MARTPGFDWEVDVSDAQNVAGMMYEIGMQMRTAKHTAPVMKYVYEVMSQEFNQHVDLMARAFGQPQEEDEHLPGNPLHHVYEWNMIGVPQARLWSTVMRGRGREREISWNWKASKSIRPIPIVDPGPQGQQLREVHVFVWKAPIMEYNVPVTINPKIADHLAFPDPTIKRGLFFTSAGVTLRNPGGKSTTGAFTAAFTDWWTGSGAETAFDDRLKQALEQDFSERSLAPSIPKATRSTAKTFKFKTMTADASWDQGRKVGRRFMENRTHKYYRMIEQRFGNLEESVEEYDV